MSCTTLANLSPASQERPLVTRQGWLWIAVLGALFILFFQHALSRWFFNITLSYNWPSALANVLKVNFDHDWSHGLIVPVISIYFIHQNRERLLAARRRVCWWGLPLMLAGMLSFAWWIWPGRNDMLQGYSMVLTLLGLVLFLLGPGMMRTLWFPILYLALAVKVSNRLWEMVAWKLQLVAAHATTLLLRLLGLDASVEGTTIELFKGIEHLGKLNVAEACSGLRMLMAFIALGTAMAFLAQRPLWQRLAMVAMTIPVAVLVNVGRVTSTGLLYLVDKEMAGGDFHTFIGLVMLIPAAGLFWLLGWVMDQLIIYDQPPASPAPASAPPALQPPLPETPAGPSPAPAVAVGLVLGVAMTALLGATYLLSFFLLRPDDFAGGRFTQGHLALAAGLAAILALGAIIVPWRLSRRRGHASAWSSSFANAIVAGVLLVAVLGLSGMVAANKTILIKLAVPARADLFLIADKAGSWTKVSEAPPLSAEMILELGTKQYISRSYQDASLPPGSPGSVVHVHVAYYTGIVDTVPHVPERCFVAGGYRPITTQYPVIQLAGDQFQPDPAGHGWIVRRQREPRTVRLPDLRINTTLFSFTPSNSPHNASNVIYFFAANGRFLPTPDAVRFQGFDPRDRHSYYCKIEVMVPNVAKPAAAQERVTAFLSAMLPEIMAVLPDWVDVTEGRWPLKDGN